MGTQDKIQRATFNISKDLDTPSVTPFECLILIPYCKQTTLESPPSFKRRTSWQLQVFLDLSINLHLYVDNYSKIDPLSEAEVPPMKKANKNKKKSNKGVSPVSRAAGCHATEETLTQFSEFSFRRNCIYLNDSNQSLVSINQMDYAVL